MERMPHAGRSRTLAIAMSVGLLLGASSIANASGGGSDAALLARLRKAARGEITVLRHRATGRVRFLAAPAGRTLARSREPDPESAARAFLVPHGALFGIADARGLDLLSVKHGENGRTFARFRQTHAGVPVVGGELVVQMDATLGVLSAGGEASPSLALDTQPGIDPTVAEATALALVSKHHGVRDTDLRVQPSELWIFDPALLGAGVGAPRLVWRTEVSLAVPGPVRELVLVDAVSGAVALHFNQVATARDRRIYDDANNPQCPVPGCTLVRSEGQPPASLPDANFAYDYAGDTYDVYASFHGRDSIDGQGMPLVQAVRFCDPTKPCPYPNAFWSQGQMFYGEGFASADDVVGHEMTHGVTENESHLFYYFQSGAVNESLSDIWGEAVDLTNGRGNDGPTVRWLIGEDLPGGAGRNMMNPGQFGDPDAMTSPNYHCGSEDNGGVHTNSGVGNKAAVLMVDGGMQNGIGVAPIGLPKTIAIFYDVQTHYLTSSSDYADLDADLLDSCTRLIGFAGITAGDCQQVRNALDAVAMSVPEACGGRDEAPVCDGGAAATDVYLADFENQCAGWGAAALVGLPAWACAPRYATSGVTSLFGADLNQQNDSYATMTGDVALPAGTTYLHFRHAHDFEAAPPDEYYDGGVLEYSANGGTTWSDAGPLFDHGAYNGVLSGIYGNPLGGRAAFSASSRGYYSSRLDLSPLAGHQVRFRFRVGTDADIGMLGWFIDDVRIYTCGGPPTTTTTSTTATTTHTSSTATTSTTTTISTTTSSSPTSSATSTTAPSTTSSTSSSTSSSTTSSTTSTVTSTTSPPPACTSDAQCADAEPCTIDTCTGGACVHTALEGTERVDCELVELVAPDLCAPDNIDPPLAGAIVTQVGKARLLLARAAAAGGRRQRKLLAKVDAALKALQRQVNRAGKRGRITSACRGRLTQLVASRRGLLAGLRRG